MNEQIKILLTLNIIYIIYTVSLIIHRSTTFIDNDRPVFGKCPIEMLLYYITPNSKTSFVFCVPVGTER